MGQNNSRETELTQEETEAAHQLKQRVENEGPEAIATHVSGNLDRWKKEKLKIGITGRTKTGKSTFINAILGLRPNQPGAAKSGSGNTTQHITSYTHPRNDKIVLLDFPGVGTEEHPKSKYITKVNASNCDYFFIFFDSVIGEDDIWLAERLTENNKPFCFVRSMIDQDIYNAIFDGKNADTVLEEVREKVKTSIASNSITRETSIFFISCRYTDVGEFPQLLNHMEINISSLKFELILFSISAISKDVIEKKYQKLKSRVRIVSVGAAAISAEPIPYIDDAINKRLIVNELHHYIDTFGISMDIIESLSAEVKKGLSVWSILTKSDTDLASFVSHQIETTIEVDFINLIAVIHHPALKSLITSPRTFVKVKDLLNTFLDRMKEDAIIIYDNVMHAQKLLHTNAQVIRS